MTFTPPSSLGAGIGGAVAVTQATSPWVVGDGGGSLTVDGPLTNAELRASAVAVDGSAVTQPVSVGSLPLPDGAATEATLGEVLAAETGQARLLSLLTGQALGSDTSDLVAADE